MSRSSFAGISRPTRALIVYLDPRQLAALDRPAFRSAGQPLIVELAPISRLRTADGPQLTDRIVSAPATPTADAQVLDAAERAAAHAGPDETVLFVCHVDDAARWLPMLDEIDDVRLVWHPAAVADASLERLIGLLEAAPLADAIGPHPIYFSSLGHPASAADWRQSTTCPILGMLTDTARRRRLRASEPDLGWAALDEPGPARLRLSDSLR